MVGPPPMRHPRPSTGRAFAAGTSSPSATTGGKRQRFLAVAIAHLIGQRSDRALAVQCMRRQFVATRYLPVSSKYLLETGTIQLGSIPTPSRAGAPTTPRGRHREPGADTARS